MDFYDNLKRESIRVRDAKRPDSRVEVDRWDLIKLLLHCENLEVDLRKANQQPAGQEIESD